MTWTRYTILMLAAAYQSKYFCIFWNDKVYHWTLKFLGPGVVCLRCSNAYKLYLYGAAGFSEYQMCTQHLWLRHSWIILCGSTSESRDLTSRSDARTTLYSTISGPLNSVRYQQDPIYSRSIYRCIYVMSLSNRCLIEGQISEALIRRRV